MSLTNNCKRTLIALVLILFVVAQSYLMLLAIKSQKWDLQLQEFMASYSGVTVALRLPKATIAYAISITGCDVAKDSLSTRSLIDGATTLKHSIHLNSFHNAPHSDSKYSYQMYAFVHPDAVPCSQPFWPHLERAHYKILVRDTPFNISDLQSEFLRTHMNQTGCCGEKEFLKIYAYTLTDHPIAVHLDVDTLILQPLDELFDSMLEIIDEGNSEKEDYRMLRDDLQIMNDTFLPLPDQPIQAFFTRDYGMVHPGKRNVGVQGGFIIVRPNQTVFEEQIQAILTAEFISGAGWAGRYGGYYGAMQIQGFISYYYDGLHPDTAVELDYCIYNNMVNFPSENGVCLGPPFICQDCRNTHISAVKTAHFTDKCYKPWTCSPNGEVNLCHNLTKEWFRIRRDYESRISPLVHPNSPEKQENLTTSPTICTASYNKQEFLGCCKSGGNRGYIPLATIG
jgi:hypothetical protein